MTKAIIADDEPQLRTYLKSLLEEVWPELKICAEAGNGPDAVAAVNRYGPEIAFLDIRMPGLTGLQVAEEIAPACRIVFVTAYDEYAVDAFEKEALDYLLKPVTRQRLKQAVERLKKQLTHSAAPLEETIAGLRGLVDRLTAAPNHTFLQWLRVQRRDSVELVPVRDVIYFQASDKYTAVITRSGESLIRKSIRDLNAELDPNCFQQIHRGTIVNLAQVDSISRSLTGRGVIRLKNRPETLTVSRSFIHVFKQM